MAGEAEAAILGSSLSGLIQDPRIYVYCQPLRRIGALSDVQQPI
jgi:hypothetical protein